MLLFSSFLIDCWMAGLRALLPGLVAGVCLSVSFIYLFRWSQFRRALYLQMVDRVEYERIKKLKDQFRHESTQHQQDSNRLKAQSNNLKEENERLKQEVATQKQHCVNVQRQLDEVKEVLRQERADLLQTQGEARYYEQECFIARQERDEFKEKYDGKDEQWKLEKQRYFDRTTDLERKLADVKRNFDKYLELQMGMERGRWNDQLCELEAERNAALLTAETLKTEHQTYRDKMSKSNDIIISLTSELQTLKEQLKDGSDSSIKSRERHEYKSYRGKPRYQHTPRYNNISNHYHHNDQRPPGFKRDWHRNDNGEYDKENSGGSRSRQTSDDRRAEQLAEEFVARYRKSPDQLLNTTSDPQQQVIAETSPVK